MHGRAAMLMGMLSSHIHAHKYYNIYQREAKVHQMFVFHPQKWPCFFILMFPLAAEKASANRNQWLKRHLGFRVLSDKLQSSSLSDGV